MSDGRMNIIRRSALLLNKAAAAFYSYPVAEKGFYPEDRALVQEYNNHRPFGPAPRFCYAPYMNMFFNTEGRVQVCCKNTRVVLGQYPLQNLHEMWFGQRLQDLREYLQHHDLSMGCYKCREAMHARNYGSMTSAGFDFSRAYPPSHYPRLMEFELSNACNLECVMCTGRVSSSIRAHREARAPLAMRYDQAFVKQLDEFIPHLKQARFYGGEPFMIPIYNEIWKSMIRQNPQAELYVLTNGTLLNERIIELVNEGNFTINVSIDSLNKETYEAIRVNASFAETMKNLEFFSAAMKKKKKRLTVFITPTRLNWQDIPSTVMQFAAMDLDVYFSPALFPESLALWNLPAAEILQIVHHFKTVMPASGINRQRYSDLIHELEYWAVQQEADPDFQEKFRAQSREQEMIHEQEKPVLHISHSVQYRQRLLSALQSAEACDEAQAERVLQQIDDSIRESGAQAVLIYNWIATLESRVILEKARELNPEAMRDLFARRQQELIMEFELKP
jgi:sulfatase maturation enzyme AslB (radical SAM superfamily)